MAKDLPAMQEIWVRSLGREDPLEKEMTTPSSILAWRFPWTEEPGGLQSMGLQRVGHECAHTHIHEVIKIGCRIVSLFLGDNSSDSRLSDYQGSIISKSPEPL